MLKATKKSVERITARDVERALRVRFAAPAWAFLAQVRNGTGYSRERPRTADAIAFSTWPSRGLELHGIEIKISRNDVRRELEDPAKAEDFVRFCDRWWLAVSDEELVQPGELPPTWGLLVMRGGRIACKVEAPKLDAQPLDRVQLAAIFRCVADANTPTEEVEERIKAETEQQALRVRDNNAHALTELRESVDAFEKASGVKISEPWQGPERIGEAVRLVLSHQHPGVRVELDRLRERAREIMALLDTLDGIARGAA